MSRVNANPIYTGNTFRNLNAIKANNEVKSNVALSDEVELGAAKRSWSGVGCQTLSDGYYKIPVNAGQDEKYCFSYDSRAEVDGKWIFQTAVKHNSGTIRQLSLNLEWLKKNKKPTFYVKDLQKNRLWIEWPVWKGNGTDNDLEVLNDVEVMIRAFKENPGTSTVAKNVKYKENQYWTHQFFS